MAELNFLQQNVVIRNLAMYIVSMGFFSSACQVVMYLLVQVYKRLSVDIVIAEDVKHMDI